MDDDFVLNVIKPLQSHQNKNFPASVAKLKDFSKLPCTEADLKSNLIETVRGFPKKASSSKKDISSNVSKRNKSKASIVQKHGLYEAVDEFISHSLKFDADQSRHVEKKIIDSNSAEESSSIDFEALMNTQIEPRIEPIFSRTAWSELSNRYGIHSHLTSCLTVQFKLVQLTSIQAITIPTLLKGSNALVRAQTGSGKTLAYAVPMFNQLMNLDPPISRVNGPVALVVLPTRELATQTYDVLQILGKACVRIVSGCFIGGMKRKAQKVSLRKGVNIVIGTPQRLLDHLLRTSSLLLTKLRWFIIDEADRLLEMGFERDLRRIVGFVNQAVRSRQSDPDDSLSLQTVLLSATLTSGVEQLAGLVLPDAVRCMDDKLEGINLSSQAVDRTAAEPVNPVAQFALPAGLRHFLLIVPWKLRFVALAAFLLLKCRYHKKGGKLIVFMATQHCVDFHHRLLQEVLCAEDEEVLIPSLASRLLLFRLHGNMEHSERESVFHKFSSSKSGVLLTTDVASRGLDLAAVGWVVQYQVSGNPVDYVHRVGRTARAGGRGKALLFLSPDEIGYTGLLKACAGVQFQQLNLSELMQTSLFHMQNTKRAGHRKNANCTTVEESISRFSHLFLDAVTDDTVLTALAESAYTSFLRSYASFSGELRTCFMFKRLHLGHVARAFCLQSTPRDIASRVTGRLDKKRSSNISRKPTSKSEPLNERSDSTMESAQHRKRPAELLEFERKPTTVRHSKIPKPSEKAHLNMLAEFGL